MQLIPLIFISLVFAWKLLPWQARRAQEAKALDLGPPTLPKAEPLRLVVLREETTIYAGDGQRERQQRGKAETSAHYLYKNGAAE
jgi:hypothetical protein